MGHEGPYMLWCLRIHWASAFACLGPHSLAELAFGCSAGAQVEISALRAPALRCHVVELNRPIELNRRLEQMSIKVDMIQD